jgi:hypothetical protein
MIRKPSEAGADAERRERHDAVTEQLKRNPRFRVMKRSGNGFIIGGVPAGMPGKPDKA